MAAQEDDTLTLSDVPVEVLQMLVYQVANLSIEDILALSKTDTERYGIFLGDPVMRRRAIRNQDPFYHAQRSNWDIILELLNTGVYDEETVMDALEWATGRAVIFRHMEEATKGKVRLFRRKEANSLALLLNMFVLENELDNFRGKVRNAMTLLLVHMTAADVGDETVVRQLDRLGSNMRSFGVDASHMIAVGAWVGLEVAELMKKTPWKSTLSLAAERAHKWALQPVFGLTGGASALARITIRSISAFTGHPRFYPPHPERIAGLLLMSFVDEEDDIPIVVSTINLLKTRWGYEKDPNGFAEAIAAWSTSATTLIALDRALSFGVVNAEQAATALRDAHKTRKDGRKITEENIADTISELRERGPAHDLRWMRLALLYGWISFQEGADFLVKDGRVRRDGEPITQSNAETTVGELYAKEFLTSKMSYADFVVIKGISSVYVIHALVDAGFTREDSAPITRANVEESVREFRAQLDNDAGPSG